MRAFLALACLALSSFVPFAFGSTIFGTVFNESSFEPREGVVVVVNSTPAQQYFSKNGSFSFEVEAGQPYSLKVFDAKTSALFAFEEIFAASPGEFQVDIIPFFEPPEEELPELGDESADLQADEFPFLEAAAALAIGLLAAIWLFATHAKKQPAPEKPFPPQNAPARQARPSESAAKEASPASAQQAEKKNALTKDARELLALIRENGGIATQKELRFKVDYSEARASLLVSELEDAGLVKRIKKGRGNIVKIL